MGIGDEVEKVVMSRTVGVEVGSMEGERQTRKGSIFLIACMHIILIYHQEVCHDQYQYLYRAYLPDNNGEL